MKMRKNLLGKKARKNIPHRNQKHAEIQRHKRVLSKTQRETLLGKILVCLVVGRRKRLEEWGLGNNQTEKAQNLNIWILEIYPRQGRHQ